MNRIHPREKRLVYQALVKQGSQEAQSILEALSPFGKRFVLENQQEDASVWTQRLANF